MNAPVVRSRRHIILKCIGLVGLLLAVAALRLFTGSGVDVMLWDWSPSAAWIRIHELCIALLAGMALAASGVGLQALLRNPLAAPFILGLSTGAGVGVMAQHLIVGNANADGHLGAIAGAALSMSIVLLASQKRGLIDPLGLLLTGVALSTINGAVIMLLNYLVGPGGMHNNLANWMMGRLNANLTIQQIIIAALVVLLGIMILFAFARAADVASFSDAETISMGVNLKRLRLVLFICASVLAATAVVMTGPIAFIGLVSPHLARLLLGPSHRTLLLGAVLIGAVLMILANTASIASDKLLATGAIPLGVFTAMFGGPVFVWMLRPHMGKQ